MLAWHLAAALFLFRWIFRDPKVDVRFLLAGAILPDLIDLSVVTIAGGETAELWGHSLIIPSLLATVVLLSTRRGRRRRAWMALVVGWLLHLLVDGMWTDARLFLWPAFGFDLDLGGAPFWPGAWERALADPWRWVKEVGGLAYLIWLWRHVGLSDPERRSTLRRRGRIAAPARER